MKIWLTRFRFFLKIIAKMRAKALILKETGEYVELIHASEIDGTQSYLVELSDGRRLTVTPDDLTSRHLVKDPKLAIGFSAAAAAILALLSMVASDWPIQDLVQEAQSLVGADIEAR